MALNVSGDGVIHCNYEWFLYTKDGVGYTNWYGQHTTEKLQLNNIRDNWRALVSPDRQTPSASTATVRVQVCWYEDLG